jgi:hypothetical protein
MLKRISWMIILVIAIVIDLWWIERALGEYAAPIDLMAISALAVIISCAVLQIIGLAIVECKETS